MSATYLAVRALRADTWATSIEPSANLKLTLWPLVQSVAKADQESDIGCESADFPARTRLTATRIRSREAKSGHCQSERLYRAILPPDQCAGLILLTPFVEYLDALGGNLKVGLQC